MYEKKFVGLAEAEVAAKAILAEASKKDEPIAVAVVAPDGHPVYLARMDGAPWHSVFMAIKKAYSAARMRNNTRRVWENVVGRGWVDMGSSFGDDVTLIPGGVNITAPVEGASQSGPRPESYGGIGISGRPADEDEALAFIGLKALQEFVWSK
jgi:uncharacterized protein GlcG (DUF336 family)